MIAPVSDDVRDREIAELRADVAALTQRVARLEAAAHPRESQRAARAALLPVLAVSVQDRLFTAVEVMAHAAVDPKLAHALDAAGITSARSLGHLLRRAERRTLGPVHIWRHDERERDGIIWRCELCP